VPNAQQLKEIAAISSRDAFVTSLYLDVSGSAESRELLLLRADRLLLNKRKPLSEVNTIRRASVDDDCQIITEYLRNEIGDNIEPSSVRGLALFSCRKLGLLSVKFFPEHVEDSLYVGKYPDLFVYADMVHRASPLKIVLVDDGIARLFTVVMNEIRETDVDIDAAQVGHSSPDRSKTEQHLQRVASLMNEVMCGGGFAGFLLGGPREILPRLGTLVDNRLAGYIRAYLPGVSIMARKDEVLAAARRQIDAIQKYDEQAYVNSAIYANLDSGRISTDIEEILNAVSSGGVRTLILKRGIRLSGLECPRCGRLSTEIEQCPRCGGLGCSILNNLVPAIISLAIRQGSSVRVIDPHSPWAGRNHMTAVLSQPLPSDEFRRR